MPTKTNGKTKTPAPISPRTARRLRQKLHMAEEINASLAATLDIEHRELQKLRRRANNPTIADVAKAATHSGCSASVNLVESKHDFDYTAVEKVATIPVNRWDEITELLTRLNQKSIATRCRATGLHTKLIGPAPSIPCEGPDDKPGALAEYLRTINYINETLDETNAILDNLLT